MFHNLDPKILPKKTDNRISPVWQRDKTIDSRDSQLVTHVSTGRPTLSLSTAELTGSAVLSRMFYGRLRRNNVRMKNIYVRFLLLDQSRCLSLEASLKGKTPTNHYGNQCWVPHCISKFQKVSRYRGTS
ncbi:hypothetical protein HRR83_006038 [Exophiala dermatitidis]|nr:hypothetical protein HRR74_005435 [Exophiala dermatitidis]KAJ4517461.1 hypothetical protein HRR73_004513 [Exophiala dermatitidis]KAJ4548786.1 hypothetical protein HRR76_001366 [Exophiala dermatitidis]KAJ4552496.1 hypothetical protein HRR77_002504 [Exophiala dermatitidis]KAJ4567004.1 hypothetical protein HRR81_007080 [Exophiala dermatitidis]